MSAGQARHAALPPAGARLAVEDLPLPIAQR